MHVCNLIGLVSAAVCLGYSVASIQDSFNYMQWRSYDIAVISFLFPHDLLVNMEFVYFVKLFMW